MLQEGLPTVCRGMIFDESDKNRQNGCNENQAHRKLDRGLSDFAGPLSPLQIIKYLI